MPLTFAHPAAILPFSRKSRYVNFSAMVLGSMAPDFEYFLRGQPIGSIGHTFSGFIFFNLPLVILIYFIYHTFVHQVLCNHLPVLFQDTYTKRDNSKLILKVIVFCYSALFGMVTHISWDSFTHKNGYMVVKFPNFFTYSYHIFGFDIPIYKLLQHGSTLFGILIILLYMYFRARFRRNANRIQVAPRQKLIFWSLLSLLTVAFIIIWYLIDYVTMTQYGIVVVRAIDSAFLGLIILSMFKHLTR